MPMQKDQTPLCEKQVSSSQQPYRREEESLNRSVSLLQLCSFRPPACPCLLCPSRYLSAFASFHCERACASIQSHFSSSCICGKRNQREKSMHPTAIKNAFMESMFILELYRRSLLFPTAICEIKPALCFFLFIIDDFRVKSL